VFWDANPADKKLFVADPSNGSRHNRGCAVDLTPYDLKTRKPVEMVSTYNETTYRASPDHPGGTSLQCWHRDLLRSAMESEGFTVYPNRVVALRLQGLARVPNRGHGTERLDVVKMVKLSVPYDPGQMALTEASKNMVSLVEANF
jgi:D-ala-D-ala dipeptidase